STLWPDARPEAPSETPPVSHTIWDTLLHRHVREGGLVDYKGFIRDSVALNRYLAVLSGAQPNEENWTRAEKMAFWINAYNAFTVKLIVDHYPVESIKDIKRGVPFVNTVWDIKFIKIGGQTYDLNNIEHGILRPDFKDARVHAAINCASYSCPQLRNEAFVAERLEAQLDDAMRKFVNDPLRNRITAKRAEISEIFKWFRADFVRDAGSVRKYVNRYAQEKLDANGRIVYLDYQWSLNDVK
ncbi:MAG: DUF547 domain-containing protein, partial [Saprospiraceae bacterium]|nr:DUF547 domain-containing protein [Saprospiraceae bacterium]